MYNIYNEIPGAQNTLTISVKAGKSGPMQCICHLKSAHSVHTSELNIYFAMTCPNCIDYMQSQLHNVNTAAGHTAHKKYTQQSCCQQSGSVITPSP